MNFIKINTIQLIFILGLIILLIPPLLIKTSYFDFFSLGNENEIGDTLGGITSPFINSIAAILVFIAFKEQVKANNLIKEQQYFQHIQEQIYRLEDEYINLAEINDNIERDISIMHDKRYSAIGETKPRIININLDALNKALYSTVIFQQTVDLINNLENNKEFMQNKIKLLYLIIYRDNYLKIDKTLKSIIGKSDSEPYIAELLLEIKKLQELFPLNKK